MGPQLAIIAAIASIGSTAYSFYSQSKAASAENKARTLEAQQQALASARERSRAIRETRIQRAAALNTANQVGAAPGSSALTGISSLSSDLGSNLGYNLQQSALSGLISQYLGRAASYASTAQLFGGIANFAGTVYAQTKGPSTSPTPKPYTGIR